MIQFGKILMEFYEKLYYSAKPILSGVRHELCMLTCHEIMNGDISISRGNQILTVLILTANNFLGPPEI